MFFKTEPYPTTEPELRAAILSDAIGAPAKKAMTYFEEYFDKGGSANHPILGDLRTLVTQINEKHPKDKGINLVAGLISHRLDKLKNTEPDPTNNNVPK